MKIIIQIKILKRTILTMTVLTATIFARRRRCAIVTKKTRCTIATITKASSVSTLREEERGTRGRGCGWKEQRNQTRREPKNKNLIKEQNKTQTYYRRRSCYHHLDLVPFQDIQLVLNNLHPGNQCHIDLCEKRTNKKKRVKIFILFFSMISVHIKIT